MDADMKDLNYAATNTQQESLKDSDDSFLKASFFAPTPEKFAFDSFLYEENAQTEEQRKKRKNK